ncbi:LPXTG cell wall anchor domain-containing protein [Streptomyces viridochromogenes]|uniref:Gram-positive cocci surface proteins LPxTG domain-containing protein n=1 Tax=Streptomyces viridochromogenes TaxID=1938 RepID=A0A0L8JM72_STRVR|nr:LPXTG cell wall anchor domain-containing protein [Streptomyces viridochromogenes]KOG14737.1 hypothetical protein ADK34_28295 [Streptomyces viridochromogenes]
MRSIISRKVLTAAAATGILSLSGGFALAAGSHAGTGDGSGPAAGHAQAPLPPEVCGESMELGGFVAEAVGDLCAHAEDPDGYGDEPTHPPTTQPPTHPPTTHPPTTQPPTAPPTKPTTPPTGPPELPDTGSDAALMGAAAISAALIIGGSVVYLRGGRVTRRH